MSNGDDTSKSTPDRRRAREIEIDDLIGHECASRSSVSDLLWRRAGLDPPTGPVKVEYQQLCGDGRVADVRVTARDGCQLLIEDKAGGGSFQRGQVENYQRITTASVRTVLIAPESFIRAHSRDAGYFSAAVSLEEISNALETPPSEASVELAASYAHRRDEFLRCARDPGWVGNPSGDVSAFGDRYRRLAKEVTPGEIALTPKTLSHAGARMVEFDPWAEHDNAKPFHKLDQGFLDVRIKDLSLQELRERLEALEALAPLPKGWKADKQRASKYPVLRYQVDVIGGDLSAAAFEAVRPIIAEALRALADLKSWWDHYGAKRLLK